jgi:hypothetical protein
MRILITIEGGVLQQVIVDGDSDGRITAYAVDYDKHADDPVIFGEHHVERVLPATMDHYIAEIKAEVANA